MKHRLGGINLGVCAFLITLALFLVIYTASGSQMFSPGGLSEQAHRKVPRGGASSHQEIAGNCAACHAPPWSSATMANRCLECHVNVRQQIDAREPLHGKMPAGMECLTCHTEHHGPKASLTTLNVFERGGGFHHDWTAFPLTGKHRLTDCNACHKSQSFQGTSHACVACHAEPPVHKGHFGTACASCHSTETWTLAGTTKLAHFDHDTTKFKLTGKHQSTDCRACHTRQVGKETVSVFKGTSDTCVSCHAREAQVHKGHYEGSSCVQCHSTHAWTGALVKHSFFSINHGRRNNNCKTCHNDAPVHFQTYTCYNCHEHTPAKVERQHARRQVANLQDCASCHARKGNRRAEAVPPGFMAELCSLTACEVTPLEPGDRMASESIRDDRFCSSRVHQNAGVLSVSPRSGERGYCRIADTDLKLRFSITRLPALMHLSLPDGRGSDQRGF
jgi:hypothetical protein